MSRIIDSTKNWSISDVVEKVEGQKVGLPNFQRDFVWEVGKTKGLLESICLGLPMGTMMALDVSHANPAVASLRPMGIKGAKWPKAPKYPDQLELLMLDGQQRMTAVFHAFTNDGPHAHYIDLKEYRDTHDIRKAIKYVARTQGGRNHDLQVACEDPHDYGAHAKFRVLPFPSLLNTEGYHIWAQETATALVEQTGDQAWKPLLQEDIVRAEVWQNVAGYKVNIEVLKAETTLQTLCEVFVAINTGGKKLTMFDIMVAKLQSDSSPFDLKKEWATARETRPALDVYGVDGLDVLKCLALLKTSEGGLSKASSRDADVILLDGAFVKKHWKKTLDAYANVIDTLKANCCVFDKNLLSYTSLLVPLVAACRKRNVRLAATAAFRPKLVRYYWSTVFTSFYTQGAGGKQGTEFAALCRWQQDDSEIPESVADAIGVAPKFGSAQSAGSAIFSGTIAALLAERAPELMDWMSDTAVRYLWEHQTQRTEADIHHIFPRNWLRIHHPAAEPETVLNKTPISGETNKWIQDNAPSDYIANMIAEISREHGLTPAKAKAQLKQKMATHGITSKAFAAMEADDYDKFLEARNAALTELARRCVAGV